MKRRSHLRLLFLTVAVVTLSCVVPPEVINAIYRLPTPDPTATPAPSEILYVDQTGDDANDCLSTAAACRTIQAALRKAGDGAAIYIGPGTYIEDDGLTDSAWSFDSRNVSLYGAESSGGLTTILSGGGNQNVIGIFGDGRVVLENLAIIDGQAGLYVGGSGGLNVSLRNVAFRNLSFAAVRILDTSADGLPIVTLDDVRINNIAHGAISNEGDLTLRHGRLSGDGPLDTSLGWGSGVIYNRGTLRMADTTVSGATADTHVINNQGVLTLERATLSGFSAGTWSALYNAVGASLNLTNSTVSGNSGTGITTLGNLTLLYSTIAFNGRSGMFANSGPDPVAFRVENSLIENNGAQDCIYQVGNHITLTRSGPFLSDGSCLNPYGGVFTPPRETDAFLGPLADNGGPTQTHALLTGSRAIDAAEGPCLASDQRGVARPIGGGCDVGAYEYSFALTAATPETPAGTPVPIWTPTPTAPAEPQVTLLENANCRIGPGTGYNLLTILNKGQTVKAVGRIAEPTWYQVEDPKTAKACWVAAELLTVPFDPKLLPIAEILPLPGTPGSFRTAGATCSANLKKYSVELAWSAPGGETGFRLYRNGELIATLAAGVSAYTDAAPKGTALSYEIEAYNANGHSPRATLAVPAC